MDNFTPYEIEFTSQFHILQVFFLPQPALNNANNQLKTILWILLR